MEMLLKLSWPCCCNGNLIPFYYWLEFFFLNNFFLNLCRHYGTYSRLIEWIRFKDVLRKMLYIWNKGVILIFIFQEACICIQHETHGPWCGFWKCCFIIKLFMFIQGNVVRIRHVPSILVGPPISVRGFRSEATFSRAILTLRTRIPIV